MTLLTSGLALDEIVLAVDVGKTSCRARVLLRGQQYDATATGGPGLANGEGQRIALAAIEAAAGALPPFATRRIDRVGIGAAGAYGNREGAELLAQQVSRVFSAPVVVTSDALAAHVGALGGASGTVIIAGTGAVAFGLDDDGRLTRADGWGIWLGDDGSGRWIGQEGIKSALRQHDGRGLATTLSDAVAEVAGVLDLAPAYVSSGIAPERVLASFAPIVLEHAERGDAVALAIVTEAVRLLTETAVVAAPPGRDVCILGGLTNSPLFAGLIVSALTNAGLHVVQPIADALAGAALLAHRSDLPHERYAIRA